LFVGFKMPKRWPTTGSLTVTTKIELWNTWLPGRWRKYKMSVSIRPSIDKNQKDFSLIFFVWYVVCKMEMARVNDGARLEKEKRKLCVWGSKMAAPKEEGGGRKPWEV
jgi:hypothetical protein